MELESGCKQPSDAAGERGAAKGTYAALLGRSSTGSGRLNQWFKEERLVCGAKEPKAPRRRDDISTWRGVGTGGSCEQPVALGGVRGMLPLDVTGWLLQVPLR